MLVLEMIIYQSSDKHLCVLLHWESFLSQLRLCNIKLNFVGAKIQLSLWCLD